MKKRSAWLVPFDISLASLLIILAFTGPRAQATLYVGSSDNGTVSTYTNSGALFNPTLISGLDFVRDIAVSGNRLYVLYVADNQFTTVGVYTTSGRPINPTLLTSTSLDSSEAIAVSGNNIFIGSDVNNGSVSLYTTSGALVNPSLITGLQASFIGGFFGDMAISGDKLFVASWGSNEGLKFVSNVGEYTLSGAPIDADLITFRQGIAGALAVSGSNIYVENNLSGDGAVGIGTIGLYTTGGELVNPAFITGVTDPYAIALTDEAIFVGNGAIISGTLGKYTFSGEVVDPEIVNNLGTVSLAVGGSASGVPDSMSTLWLGLPVIGLLAASGLRRRRVVVGAS
jgi:hypothetical protein